MTKSYQNHLIYKAVRVTIVSFYILVSKLVINCHCSEKYNLHIPFYIYNPARSIPIVSEAP